MSNYTESYYTVDGHTIARAGNVYTLPGLIIDDVNCRTGHLMIEEV